MRSLLIVFAVVGVAVARPGFVGLGIGARSLIHTPAAYSSVVAPAAYSTVAHSVAPISYTAVAPAVAPVVAPAPITYAAPHATSSQYHAQDELGQYSYGYAGGPSAKSEVKTWDGVTRGGYSYVDAEGKVQSVNYVADAVNGFRVAATNLPVAPVAPEPLPVEPLVAPTPVEDTAEVIAARDAHFAAVAEAKAAAEAAPEEPEVVEEPVAVDVEAPVAEDAVAVAPADVLPASVLSRTVAVEAIAPAHFAYSAPAIAPISYTAQAVAPITYSAPAVAPIAVRTHNFAPITYSAHAVSPISYAAPAVAPISYSAVAPAVAHAPIAYAAPHATSSQFHAQDELGQYSYGYAGGPSAKTEVKTWDGVTRGGYSYVDAEGKVQNVNYVADPVHGFRVAATNLPVAPVAPEAPVLEAIPDSPEVVEAKAAHFAAHEEAKARLSS